MAHWTHEQKYFLMLWRKLPMLPMLPPIHGRIMSLSALFESLVEYLKWEHSYAQPHRLAIIKEVREYLKSTNLLSDDNFKDDYEDLLVAFSLDISQSAHRLSLSEIVISLRLKISTFSIWKLYSSACRRIFASPNIRYHQLDDLASAWICELGTQGYSMRFIQDWAKSIHLGTMSFDEFIKRMEVELDGSTRRYTSYVRFETSNSLPDTIAYQRTLSMFDPSDWCHGECKAYFEESGKFAKITLEACDSFSAAQNSVRQVMQYARDLSLLNPDPNYKPDPTASTVVLEHAANGIVTIEKESLLLLRLDNVKRLMEIANRDDFNEETYARIAQVLYWATHHSATNPEAQLAQTWTAMESLFSSARFTGSATDQIGKHIRFFSSLAYMSTYTQSIAGMLRQSKAKLQEQLGSIAEAATSIDLSNSLKVSRYELAQLLIEHGDVLIQAAQKDDILKRMLSDYLDCMKTPHRLSKRLTDEHSVKVLSDITQVYRYRNKFVHQGYIGGSTVRFAMERLQYYIKATLETLIFAFSMNPQLEISQLLTVIERRHEHHMRWLKSAAPNSDVKRTIQPTWLYI